MQLVLQRTLSAIVRKCRCSFLSDSRTAPNPIRSARQPRLSISHRGTTGNVYQRYHKQTQTHACLCINQDVGGISITAHAAAPLISTSGGFWKKTLERQATKLCVSLMLFSLLSLSPCPGFRDGVITRSGLFKWKSKNKFLCQRACHIGIY